MIVTDVKVYILKKNLNSLMRISRGGFTERTHGIVEVVTDEGITGLGEAVGNPLMVKGIVDSQLKHKLLGKDPFQIESLRKELFDGFVYFERMGSEICAASAIETALWDIKGKKCGAPVYELLGGKVKEKIPAYVSDVYWQENAGAMVNACKRIVDKGFNGIKAHLGVEGPDQEAFRIEEMRKAIGNKVKIMVDLNCGYSLSQSLQAIRLWQEFDLFWLEEPLHPAHIHGLKSLRERSAVPIAAGENDYQLFGFKNLFDLGCVDIAMPDIGRTGGIWETKLISALANSYGVDVSPHNFSSGVLLSATLHLLASDTHANFLEFDLSDNAIYLDFFIEPPRIEDGFIFVPDVPGLGVELTDDIKERYLERPAKNPTR